MYVIVEVLNTFLLSGSLKLRNVLINNLWTHNILYNLSFGTSMQPWDPFSGPLSTYLCFKQSCYIEIHKTLKVYWVELVRHKNVLYWTERQLLQKIGRHDIIKIVPNNNSNNPMISPKDTYLSERIKSSHHEKIFRNNNLLLHFMACFYFLNGRAFLKMNLYFLIIALSHHLN